MSGRHYDNERKDIVDKGVERLRGKKGRKLIRKCQTPRMGKGTNKKPWNIAGNIARKHKARKRLGKSE